MTLFGGSGWLLALELRLALLFSGSATNRDQPAANRNPPATNQDRPASNRDQPATNRD